MALCELQLPRTRLVGVLLCGEKRERFRYRLLADNAIFTILAHPHHRRMRAWMAINSQIQNVFQEIHSESIPSKYGAEWNNRFRNSNIHEKQKP